MLSNFCRRTHVVDIIIQTLTVSFLIRSAKCTLGRVSSSFMHPHRSSIVHTFASSPLNRNVVTSSSKSSEEFLQALSKDTKFLLFHGTNVLVRSRDGKPSIAWTKAGDLESLFGISIEDLKSSTERTDSKLLCVALGEDDEGLTVAVDLSASRPREDVEDLLKKPGLSDAASATFESVRLPMATMDKQEIAICGQGGALIAWHRLNKFCGVCGSPMLPVEAGSRRACTKCRNKAYPRIDPVCIALVYDPVADRCLLGRQRVYRPGMYSCLAGYIEQCESLEEGIRREIKEESGIDVGRCVYHSSQPWPIGRGSSCQLMVGFLCEALSTEIHVDRNELEDARWFTREEITAATSLPVMLKKTEEVDKESLSIPGPYAIAHHLIKHWLDLPRNKL